MSKGRLEDFSDAFLAIIITIMVLELKIPHGTDVSSLKPLIPVLLSYILSFIYIGIYWNNHHHLFHTVKQIDGRIMWANHHLLFWISLIPFVTGWLGENSFAAVPEAFYGIVLLMASIAYYILQKQIKRKEENAMLQKAVGKDKKALISPVLYALAIVSTFINQWIAGILYCAVALMWIIPDPRIERTIEKEPE